MLFKYKTIILLFCFFFHISESHGYALTPKQAIKIKKEFSIWLKNFKQKAVSEGISKEIVIKAFKPVKLNLSLPDLNLPKKKKRRTKRQPEFASPAKYFPPKYLNSLTLESRKLHKKWFKTLAKIEKKYKVKATIVLSVWGRETAFGRAKIPHYAIEVLASQAFIGNRNEYFSKQLMLALKILDQGHVSINQMKSSWAGAMGYTQFMPEDFYKHAVDFDNDGRIDIWQSVPDSLASTANYLKNNGWKGDLYWGHEVNLPRKFDCRNEGFDKGRTLEDWQKAGVIINEKNVKNTFRSKDRLYLLMPAGVKGPAFLVSENFLVIKTYNQANLYALFIGHLSDRMINNHTFQKKWPGLKTYARSHVREIQRVLATQGFDIGKIDGIIGPKTRSIIGNYQHKNGHYISCYLDKKLINSLSVSR